MAYFLVDQKMNPLTQSVVLTLNLTLVVIYMGELIIATFYH